MTALALAMPACSRQPPPVVVFPEPPAPEEPYVVEIVLDGLDFPASVNFSPDGSLFVLERGNIDRQTGEHLPPVLKRIDLGTKTAEIIRGTPDVLLLPSPIETFNGGALGMALDPDFAENGRLYICYHYRANPDDPGPGLNRLSSFVLAGDELVDERVLVDGAPGGAWHNGCRVEVGPDGAVYYSTGTGDDAMTAQRLESPGGKVLRLLPDGSVPPDNPFPGSPVWSYGHRNPQGLGFDPATGRLWSTEHGYQTDGELNLIEPGMNYGWPYCGGEARIGESWGWRTQRSWKRLGGKVQRVCEGEGLVEASYRPAVRSYYPIATVAMSDLVFYHGDAFPAWRGSLFFTTLKTGRLMRVVLDGMVVAYDQMLIDRSDPANYGRLRDVTVGPDGYLYVITNVTNRSRPGRTGTPARNPRGGMLLRIRPPD